MKKIDYLIITELATTGQKMYTEQRKRMVEDLNFTAEIVSFDAPSIRLALDFFRVAYTFRKKVEKYLDQVLPEIIEFYCPATIILQRKKVIDNFKTVASFDLPFGVNVYQTGSRFLHYFEKKKYHDVDRVISLTNYGKQFLIDNYKVKESKIVLIPYAFDQSEIERYRISDDGFAISYCPENLLWKKGLDVLIKAWSIVQNSKKLVVTGVERNNAMHYLKKEKVKVPENVEFIGKLVRHDFLSILAKSSFFVSSARFEEFGQTAIEAISFGKPVVSTPTIGPLESLKKIDINLVSQSFSSIDLANTIRYAEEHIEDQKLRQRIAKVANNYEYFNMKKIFKEKVIDELL